MAKNSESAKFASKVRTVVRNTEKQRARLQELAIEAAEQFVEHSNAVKLTVLVHELESEPRWQAAMGTYIRGFIAVRYDSKNSQYKAKTGKKGENPPESDLDGMKAIRWDKYSNESGTGSVKGFEPEKSMQQHYRKLVQDAAAARESDANLSNMLEELYASQAHDIATVIEYQGKRVPHVKYRDGQARTYKADNGKCYVSIETVEA